MAPVKVKVGAIAARALAAAGDPDAEHLALLVPRAVRFYFSERDGGRPEWSYPAFLAGHDGFDGLYELPLEQELWEELRAEAERQEVEPEKLLQHAAFYYGAARDDGRLTERIVEELQREEAGAEEPR